MKWIESQREIPTMFVGKARLVKGTFTNVEQEYDALPHSMTLSFDWAWKRRVYAKLDLSGEVMTLGLGVRRYAISATKWLSSKTR
jgi:ubiquinone/menaquinone biosynthesis C-methylase UbiE